MLISLIVVAAASLLSVHYFRGAHTLEGSVCALVAGGFALHVGYIVVVAVLPLALFLLKWGLLAAFALACGRFVKRRAMAR